MKILCVMDSDEVVDIEDAITININDNKQFTYTFWNEIKPLKCFYQFEGLDLLYISLFVFAVDRTIERKEARDSWSRDIDLFLPVLSIDRWNTVKIILEEMLSFLSGDNWKVHFRERGLTKRELEYSEKYIKNQEINDKSFNKLCMLSGGLDSFIGAINLLESTNKGDVLFISHYGGGKGTKEYQDSIKNLFIQNYKLEKEQFYQNYATVKGGKEDTTRTRSLMFFAHAIAYATAMDNDVDLIIPENGLISLNIPLSHTRLGTSSTRTTHPYYMKQFQSLLDKLEIRVKIQNPFQFKTKGEMVLECKNSDMLQSNINNTMSCSHPDNGRYKGKSKTRHCGYCLPCTIRKAALLRSSVKDTSTYAITNFKGQVQSKIAIESLTVYKVALAKFDPKLSFLKIQSSGPIEENIEEYADLYKRGMFELKAYLEELDV